MFTGWQQVGPRAARWLLTIHNVSTTDAGDYQCQLNTLPKHSLDVTLVVTGKDSDGIESKRSPS